jgi:LmbE family N-acetylglucosaminyl deacetylase
MRGLPLVELEVVTGRAAALILAPHPDDESLGCGGLIAQACEAGWPPLVVVLTDGTGSHTRSRMYPPPRLRALREAETAQAVAALGLSADRVVFMRLKDSAAPHEGRDFEAAVARIGQLAASHACSAILAPWEHDPHGDHVAAHRMAVAVSRRAALRLVSFPVWGWTLPEDMDLPGSMPVGVRLDIARYLIAKRAAIAAHASQHGRIITDDPSGFRLPANLLATFEHPFETFLAPSP